MGRPEPAGDDEQVAAQALGERGRELLGVVADDAHLGRLDRRARARLAGEEGAVEVAAVAADELRAGDEDRGARAAQSACTPPGVTVSASGRLPASATRLPPTMIARFSGELTLSQK